MRAGPCGPTPAPSAWPCSGRHHTMPLIGPSNSDRGRRRRRRRGGATRRARREVGDDDVFVVVVVVNDVAVLVELQKHVVNALRAEQPLVRGQEGVVAHVGARNARVELCLFRLRYLFCGACTTRERRARSELASQVQDEQAGRGDGFEIQTHSAGGARISWRCTFPAARSPSCCASSSERRRACRHSTGIACACPSLACCARCACTSS